ncbi:MAG: DUF116 domain-containing protein [Halobacteria archaeon]
MPYKFTFDLSVVPHKFFKELAYMVDSKRIHKRTGRILRRLIDRFKLSELTGMDFAEILQVIEDLVDIQVKNLAYRQRFEMSKNKALFLPHCARKYVDSRCRAEFDPDVPTFRCRRCSPDCQVNQASRIAEELGYDVYIVPGGSCIPKIIKKHNYDGIVGVACGEEIRLAYTYLNEDIAAQAVPLIKNGCSNTVFSIDSLCKILQSQKI